MINLRQIVIAFDLLHAHKRANCGRTWSTSHKVHDRRNSMMFGERLRVFAKLSLLLWAFSACAHTQDAQTQQPASSSETSCFSSTIASVPSRPTVSNATDTTQCGVAELEYGLERIGLHSGTHQSDVSGGLRLGLTPRLDLHWASADFLSMVSPGAVHSGFGDSWLGLKYRFSRQRKYVPSFGAFYQAKVPSADDRNGMGTGQVDHAISFLASKDFGRVHLDFNVIELLAGRPAGSGDDHQTGSALSCWVTASKKLTLVVEGHGNNELNRATPGFASALVGATYRVTSRLFLDGGIDSGITSSAPDERAFVGITFAVTNLYRVLRPSQ
jgi:hypothetical protein